MKIQNPENRISLKSLNDLCGSLCRDEKNVQACLLVGLKDGLALGFHQKLFDSTPAAYLQTVVSIVMSFYRNQQVVTTATDLQKALALAPEGGPDEMYFSISGLQHFLKIIPGQQAVLVLAVKTSVAQGLGWILLKKAMPLAVEAYSAFESSQSEPMGDYATQEFIIQPRSESGDSSPRPKVRRSLSSNR